ncbi:hypothetical protein QFZ83_000185 [Variovorax sp. W1I1]|uniref:hypothetical protein n=1 Tax=Variovorax sp. W1I1 TaxID=3042309 RepID=UPI0027812280|nr:hypothetical protein [Variovorax sp. W1I1]MDQ0606014.1 hypothetical protein [Variovorax sp. W1I1]
MADSSYAGADAGCSAASYRPTAQFKPFEWVRGEGLSLPQQRLAQFLNDTRDVVQGTHTLAQLLSWDEDRRESACSDESPAPIFNACHRGAIERLMAASLGLLSAQIERQCDALDGARRHG